MLINYHFLDQGKPFSYHTKSRSAFIKTYAEHLGTETAIGGHVMDIGCGHGINPTIELIIDKLGHVDGVDPFPAIKPHALIRKRWECKLEELPVAPETYDMAYSFNVVEHVDNVDSYLSKVVEILRPNAAYWSMSPNARHPYALCVRLLQALRLKGIYRALFAPQANDYPAYYRLCSDRLILDAIRRSRLNVAQIDFYYIHCVQWDTFLPKSLRFLANWVDKAYVLRNPKASNIFMFRLQRGA